MKEITSSYDDLEKRMAVYVGLGAMIFTSLYLFTQGADLWTYLVRGVLALAIFSIGGWAYGHWLREVFRKNSEDEELPGNVERRSRDPHAVEGRVVTHAEMPDAVIPAEEGPKVTDFAMPDFGAAGTQNAAGDEGDLPPPPVPAAP